MTTSPQPVWGTEVDWASGTLRARSGARPASQWMPAPQPATLPKRPFTFFETLDGGFRLLRFSPGATFGISMIVHTLVTLAAGLVFTLLVVGNAGFLGRVFENPEAGIGLNVVIQTVSVTASFLVLSLVQLLSAFAVVAADSAFARERMSLSAVWRALHGKRLRLVLLSAVCLTAHLVLLGVSLSPGLLLLALSPVAGVLVATLGIVLWVVATAYLFTKCALAGAALALEGLGILAALKRSWDLTRGGFWKSLGQLTLSYFLSSQVVGLILSPILFVLIVAFVLVFVVLSLDGGSGAETILAVAMSVGMGSAIAAVAIAASALMFAFLSGVVALVYLDRRMRREGYDLVVLRRAEVDEAAAARNADSTDPQAHLVDPGGPR